MASAIPDAQLVSQPYGIPALCPIGPTILYCLTREAHVCEQLAYSCYLARTLLIHYVLLTVDVGDDYAGRRTTSQAAGDGLVGGSQSQLSVRPDVGASATARHRGVDAADPVRDEQGRRGSEIRVGTPQERGRLQRG